MTRTAARALAVIAKEPVAGQAKTRLAAALGADGAARAAAAMLADTVQTVAMVDAAPWLCFTPIAARERMARLAPGFGLLPQRGAGLGERLAACLHDLTTGGAGRVAVIGADTPHLSADRYQASFALLDHADVALGPALDGGYYLIAARRPHPELFAGVAMGGGDVLASTLLRASRAGLRVALLPVARDLDSAEDLHAALATGELDASPRTRAVAAALAVRGAHRDPPAPDPGLLTTNARSAADDH